MQNINKNIVTEGYNDNDNENINVPKDNKKSKTLTFAAPQVVVMFITNT